jgi:CBS domain-containing protein
MSFHSLATHVCRRNAILPARQEGPTALLTDPDPATSVLTDFTKSRPRTVEPGRKIDAALQEMIEAGVRMLLVMEQGHLTGLITAYEIQGQKPLQFLGGSDCIHPQCRHEDIEVADIMTPVGDLPVLRLGDVRKARIGDILETFRESRKTHLLVVDQRDGFKNEIRGLISLTEIERQLGISSAHASTVRIEQESSVFSRLAE